jgi:hypothetical protein
MDRRIMTAALAVALALAVAGCGGKREKSKPVAGTENPPVPLGVNLLVNPSFEEWKGSVPVGWDLHVFERSGDGKNPSFYGKSLREKVTGNFAFYLRGVFNVNRWMTLTQRHRVTPGYRLSFGAEMMGQDLKKNRGQFERANVYIRFYDAGGKRVQERYYADGYTRFLLGTSTWRSYRLRIDIPKNAVEAEFGLICEMTGWIYFDDAEMVLEAPVPWKEIETKYVDYYYLDGFPFPSGAVDRETAFVERTVKMLKLKPEGKVSYYYYPSEEKFREMFGVKTGHERAVWAKQELHTVQPYEDHEMIHMLLAPLGYPPFGLAEGIVFYVLGSWPDGRDVNMLAKQLLVEKNVPPLYKLLDQQVMDQIGFSRTVPGWASFCMWLIDRHGIDKFMKLYVATNGVTDVAPFNEHFKKIYGKDFDAMDRDWRLWVLRYQPARR